MTDVSEKRLRSPEEEEKKPRVDDTSQPATNQEDKAASTDAAPAPVEREAKRVRVDEGEARGGSGASGGDKRGGRGGGRQGGGRGRGDWSRGGRSNGNDRPMEAKAEGEGEGSGRLPKRKVSIAFGYCGIGYSGLQINPGVKTIEGDIFDAFCELGAVSKENAVNPNKVGLQRAARTDRGVHAAGNLLTIKLILEPPGVPPGGLVDAVNAKLPEFIRIWGITRVQNSFNARTSCDSRLYEYLLPTYVFLPPKPGSAMHKRLAKWANAEAAAEAAKLAQSETAKDSDFDSEGAKAASSLCAATPEQQEVLAELLDHPFWKEHGLDKTYQEDVAAKKAWRVDAKKLQKARETIQVYKGSHNFHNFTVAKDFKDRSAHRNMKMLTISDPMEINGTEWVSIKFHGQSFMLHQIRKMIGMLVLISRTSAPPSLIAEAYGPSRIHAPKAPGLGLLLQEPFFGGYNQRVANLPKNADGAKDPIKYTAYEDKMNRFRQEWIYDRIVKTEEETSEFSKWLNYLDVLVGDDFEYLNPRGVIPSHAVLRTGVEGRPENVLKARKEADDAKKAKRAAAAAALAAGGVAAGTVLASGGGDDEEKEGKKDEGAGQEYDAEGESDDELNGDAAEYEG